MSYFETLFQNVPVDPNQKIRTFVVDDREFKCHITSTVQKVTNFPNILVLFTAAEGFNRGRFPATLRMKKEYSENNSLDDVSYRLLGAVLYSGDGISGHYTSLTVGDTRETLFWNDDDQISTISTAEEFKDEDFMSDSPDSYHKGRLLVYEKMSSNLS